MQPDAEKIIETIATLQAQTRSAIINLIESGIKLSILHPIIEASDTLDRVIAGMAVPLQAEPRCDADRVEILQDAVNGILSAPPSHQAEIWQQRTYEARNELEQAREQIRELGQTIDFLRREKTDRERIAAAIESRHAEIAKQTDL